MTTTRVLAWYPLIVKTYFPQQVQNRLLRKIIHTHRHTQFGRDYRFQKISNYDSFKKAVPTFPYEALRPYINTQDENGTFQLNTETPVLYAQTSGTTGEPKYIPILKSTISDYRKSQHLAAYAIYSKFPTAFHGKTLAIASPAEEGRRASGIPYGSMSGLIYKSMPGLLKTKYVLSPEIFEIKDYSEKYFEIAKQALLETSISMIATANPSTLVTLDRVINTRCLDLINEVRKTNRQRAEFLESLVLKFGELKYSNLWSDLKAVVTWTSGSCATQIQALKLKLSDDTQIIELGYLSSEFRGSITIDTRSNRQLPLFQENFFEFVDVEDIENENSQFLLLDEITLNRQYYIFVTTKNGLYRYDINDLIEVTGFFHRTPTIRFVQKGKGVINLTGEKLYEAQLVKAISTLSNAKNQQCPFFLLLGDETNLEYRLYIEGLETNSKDLDQILGASNLEFQNKQQSKRLKPTKVHKVRPGTGEAYKQHCLNKGQREGQFKMSHLQHKKDCDFVFDSYLERNS